jgi:transglutaminase-like putative cysteine protease
MRLPGRLFFIIILAFSMFSCQAQADLLTQTTTTPTPIVNVLGRRDYVVHFRLTLDNQGPGQPEKQNIWVALIRDMLPYQTVSSLEISPEEYTLVTDEYGNRYAEFDFSDHPAGTTKTVQINARVTVNELAYDLSVCKGELPGDFTGPELHIESANPQIVALADELSDGKETVCQQVRAFYDYIDNQLVYSFNGRNWGAQAALGPMGADCTEYASLLVALSRAKGIPARYFEGLLYLENKTQAIARLEHAWPDVYIPGVGWVALDPTMGRSLINRETYFAHYTPDHIIVTLGSSPSTLRGSSYWTHLYWPGNSTKIQVEGEWKIEPVSIGYSPRLRK